MPFNTFDVVVVGAGPAGSSCATILARNDIHVALLDKSRFPRDKICGDCVNPRCWEYFDILGVSNDIRSQHPSVIDSVAVTNSHGRRISSSITCRVEKPFFSMRRSILDSILLNAARCTGVRTFEESRVVEIQRTGLWRILVQDSDGQREIHSSILVGADGRNSIVGRTLCELDPDNMRRPAGHGRRRVAVQWFANHQPSVGSGVEMFLFDSGYSGVVNVDNKTANVALVTEASFATYAAGDFMGFLERTIFKNSRARHVLMNLQPVEGVRTVYPITPESNCVFHPHAMLIGDARQTVEPFTGEGIFFALQDGIRSASLILNRHRSDRPLRTRFWANRAYSPLLQTSWLADQIVALGSRVPPLVPLALRSVIPSTFDKPGLPLGEMAS